MSSSVDTVNNPFLSHLPESMTDFPRGLFDGFPTFQPTEGKIEKGYQKLAQKIKAGIPTGLRILVIDGYQGIEWNKFKDDLSKSLAEENIKPNWIDITEYYATPDEIRERAKPFLGGDDPLFGTHYPFGPEIFFDSHKISEVRIKTSMLRGRASGELNIIFGTGAGLIELWDQLWYIDLPKDFIQNLAREGSVRNVGDDENLSFSDYYKRSYFLDWPALNRLKKQLLPDLDLFIDSSEIIKPSFIEGEYFRKALSEISRTPFRVRPWFFPGPWGGKFMQGHMGLDPDQPNFAWSFELIVPENGIIIEKDGLKLEFSFDCLMFQQNKNILGNEAAKHFKYEWPIRLDYLDTIDGGNLSTQVHPRPDFIRKEFGETYTQDETYYIVAAKPDSKVYLGLTETCEPDEFRNALEESYEKGTEVDIDKFVYSENSKPHDLFLIPNGTVHCSGRGNLVLEISATPYIFTFKIYDYLRKDLQGKFRPLNFERGFENIRFERKENWVKENLIAKPKLLREGNDWQEYVLYDKPYTFYNIHRIEFESEYELRTEDKAFAINLVEGEKVELVSETEQSANLSYMESMVIPAAAESVKIINRGKSKCKMVLVYIKPGIGSKLPLNDPIE